MIKREGITIASVFAALNVVQSFGQDGGALSPESLTTLSETIDMPTVFIVGVILYLYRNDKAEKKEFTCPYAEKD